MTASLLTTTQPTRGFGVAVNSALPASASASHMKRRSVSSLIGVLTPCRCADARGSHGRSTGARRLCLRRRRLPLVLLRLDFANRVAKIGDVLEALVHRCEADVADLVELVELAH